MYKRGRRTSGERKQGMHFGKRMILDTRVSLSIFLLQRALNDRIHLKDGMLLPSL